MKSIYPLVDCYVRQDGVMWRARGSENGVRCIIGHYTDELEAARAAQHWLIEQLAKVVSPLHLLTHMLDSNLMTNFAVAPAGSPSRQAPDGAETPPAAAPVLDEPAEAGTKAGHPQRSRSAPSRTEQGHCPELPLLRQALAGSVRDSLLPLLRDDAGAAATSTEKAQTPLRAVSGRKINGDIVSLVAVVNGKILLSQLTCGKYWLPMTFTEALPPLHHAWDLLAQLGLDSLVGQLTFLGTQVQTLGHNTKLVTKCYGLTARTARQPTLANGRQLTWISPDRFFRLIAGVTLGMPKISQYLSLGKHSANYIALGLDTGKPRKISLSARCSRYMPELIMVEQKF